MALLAPRPPTLPSSPLHSPSKLSRPKSTGNKGTMTLTQTYFLAQLAREKLLNAARRADRDLRVLTAHATLLDGLMFDLAAAHTEQETWFNQSVRRANGNTSNTTTSTTVTETAIEDDPSEACEFDFDSEDEEDVDDEHDQPNSDMDDTSTSGEKVLVVLDVKPQPTLTNLLTQLDKDLDDDSDEDSDDSASGRGNIQQPPDLLPDAEEDSEEESHPPSPKQASFDCFARPSGIVQTLTNIVLPKGSEPVPPSTSDDDIPILGLCFSPSTVLGG